jgi:carboxylesterase
MNYPILNGAEPFTIEGNQDVFLICHGFLGTPQSVRHFALHLHQATGATISVPLLSGHGTHYKDLENSSKENWKRELISHYRHLKETYEHVWVIGQSMGATLALHLASEELEIDGLITINVALSVPYYESICKESTNHYFLESSPDIFKPIEPEITYNKVARKSVEQLLAVISDTKDRLVDIHCPILIIKSLRDHVVPHQQSDFLYQNIRSEIKQRFSLEKSYHVATLDCELSVLVDGIQDFIKRIRRHGPFVSALQSTK